MTSYDPAEYDYEMNMWEQHMKNDLEENAYGTFIMDYVMWKLTAMENNKDYVVAVLAQSEYETYGTPPEVTKTALDTALTYDFFLIGESGVKVFSKGSKVLRFHNEETGESIEDLSSKALKHPLNDHMASRYAKQVSYQSKEAVEAYLGKKSFFNPQWTEKQVTNALNSAYKDAVNQGVTNGYHTYKAYGEDIKIFMRDGKFSTGFGNHTFTYEQIINLGK